MLKNENTQSGSQRTTVDATSPGASNAGSSPLPSISFPKGGGAIRGIDEKFSANPVTGTGSMTVPIAVSPGRSGFGPQLSLSYDSGAGLYFLLSTQNRGIVCPHRALDELANRQHSLAIFHQG